MRFFSYFYLENHMYFQDYVKYITIFVALIAMLFAASHYLRHRIETKYRDLSIILLLLIIFLLGVQYTYYTQSQNYANDTSRMVAFLDTVIGSQNVKSEQVRVNGRTLSNGMIVNIDKNYYEVHFNSDFSAYTLSEINLVNPNITIVDTGD